MYILLIILFVVVILIVYNFNHNETYIPNIGGLDCDLMTQDAEKYYANNGPGVYPVSFSSSYKVPGERACIYSIHDRFGNKEARKFTMEQDRFLGNHLRDNWYITSMSKL
ncbi:hypothetical protein COU54_01465 [Candidatus Pacearchaeota archaeon CG10_big_fil_rev_8_21_14_0_10_31_24]|nr:MAG: hypothetical protein COU54_01465 [Candidatus Pacearchaeota archaeon CG10_big_fil_rev_8_21_14_0_10_31_24]